MATSLGSCDLVVNNAGVAFGGSLLGLDVADYKKTMDVNVLGPLLLSKEAFKLMIPQGAWACMCLCGRFELVLLCPMVATWHM